MQSNDPFLSVRQPGIESIIRERKLSVRFQPIISAARQMVCGVEGLIRGIDEKGEAISPPALFEAAQQEDVTLALDRLCREKVLEAFAALSRPCPDKLLFINLDTSVLSGAVSHYLFHQACTHGIDSGNIVIEINEAKVKTDEWLRGFIEEYRRLGFLIALDDIGSGFSSLNRIPLCKPDIIKIDIALVRDIDSDYHKQEVFRSLIGLSNQIGAVVVAEGVETAEEAVTALRLGAHMLQGYYFSAPQEACGTEIFTNSRIEPVGALFKQHIGSIEKQTTDRHRLIENIAADALQRLTAAGCLALDERLSGIVTLSPVIECAYVLSERGIQLSDTVFSPNCRAKENRIFYSAREGTDHSMKPYYYRLKGSFPGRHITEPYVSLATGNLCITYTGTFTDAGNKRLILCMDFIAEM
jgi:FOG: EAL domain